METIIATLYFRQYPLENCSNSKITALQNGMNVLESVTCGWTNVAEELEQYFWQRSDAPEKMGLRGTFANAIQKRTNNEMNFAVLYPSRYLFYSLLAQRVALWTSLLARLYNLEGRTSYYPCVSREREDASNLFASSEGGWCCFWDTAYSITGRRRVK